MGVYTAVNDGPLTLSEQPIYGSSRLGVWNRNVNMDAEIPDNYTFTRGNKFFELSNHLGNVLVTVSDKKIGHDAGDGTIDYYNADVVNANDYYPFGMIMPGRSYSAGTKYRYGFNGKENDNEVKGEGNQQDYGMRIYDPRLGRFLSVDPLFQTYPWYTPFQFASNSPMANVDLDGLECWAVNPSTGETASGPLYMPHYSRNNGWITGSFTNERPAPVSQPQTQKSPVLPVFSESSSQSRVFEVRKVVMTKSVQTTYVQPPITTVSQDNYSRDYHDRLNKQHANEVEEANMVAQAMETPEGQAGLGIAIPVYQVARTPVTVYEHGSQLVQNVREGNYWAATGNTVELALDVAPFIGIGEFDPSPSPAAMPTRLARVFEESYAGTPTLGQPGASDVFVTDAAELKGLTTSYQIAQKLTLKQANGNLVQGPFRIIEFDAPSSGIAQPLNRGNPGFINGGKTAGGATEYVIPNSNISDLKNVTQKTVK